MYKFIRYCLKCLDKLPRKRRKEIKQGDDQLNFIYSCACLYGLVDDYYQMTLNAEEINRVSLAIFKHSLIVLETKEMQQ